jgi:tritrans,polycis-undecaprenyl-diphosphate synthase [geranylgeranyl-diphosphate specific]
MGQSLRQRSTNLYWKLIGQALRPVYRLYERELSRQVTKAGMPKHVGIILDGNRRWARDNGLSPWEGHKMGFLKAKAVLDWCLDLDIRYVTYYTFSTENFSRMNQR